MSDLLEPTPEHELKPHLVHLGHFLGQDVYIDVSKIKGSQKQAEFFRKQYEIHIENSGQQFYDAYKMELGFGSFDNLKDMPHSEDYAKGIDVAAMLCEEAVKRAAGLEKGL